VSVVSHYIAVLGGTVGEGDKRIPATDGAVFDRTDGKWTAISQPPWAEPLLKPAVVSVGDRLLVVGPPCEEASVTAGGGEVGCTNPTELAAAWYDPGTNLWDRLPKSDVLQRAYAPIGVSPIGWVEPRAYFHAVIDSKPSIVSYDTTTHDWEQISTIPDIADPYCVTRQALVAIGQPDSSTLPSDEFVNGIAAFVYTQADWKQLGTAPEREPNEATSTVVCANGAVAYVPWLTTGAGALSFLSDEAWQQAPPLKVPVGARLSAAELANGGRIVVFTDGGQLHVFALEGTKWVELQAPTYDDALLVGGDDSVLLVPSDPVRMGIFVLDT
jgi:hypothetical protein